MDKILFKDQKKWIVTNQSDKVLENSTNALKNYGALFGLSEETFNSCMENDNISDFQRKITKEDKFINTCGDSFMTFIKGSKEKNKLKSI